MEKYINNKTVIKNDLYNLFKDSVTCEICHNILINPLMCLQCQNAFCKNCIDKKNETCPNKCIEPNFKKCISKKDILSKLKFKCQKCQNEIYYDEVMKHQDDNCTTNNNLSSINNKKIKQSKLKKLSLEEVDKYKKKGNEITYITCKKKKSFL